MTSKIDSDAFSPSSLDALLCPGSAAPDLDLHFGGHLGNLPDAVLFKPLGDLLGRPCKKIRGRLIELGFELAAGRAPGEGDERARVRALAQAIEFLHAGSLAIDDVQDGSKMRRGEPLHLKYGVPIALNLGNWLYFWPLEIIGRLGLDAARENELFRSYHRTLVRAHIGQAIDVGIPIDTLAQNQVHGACLAAMELKSGALFSLGFVMGAIVGGAEPALQAAVDRFGHGFGVGLQMFDDIGNVLGKRDPAKRFEDLVLRRPTWVWACAAKYFSRDAFVRFVSAVHQLPADHNPLETWMAQHDFPARAKRLAHQHLESNYAEFDGAIADTAGDRHAVLKRMRELGLEVARAYD